MKTSKHTVQITRPVVIDGRHCHRECVGLNPLTIGWWCGYWRKNLILDIEPEAPRPFRCRQCMVATKDKAHV